MSTTNITVRIGSDTIDPEGLGSDEEVAAAEAAVLDAVRAEWPNATVRAVGPGGRTSGDEDGLDITTAVRNVVREAFDALA